jgi:hypothetical protein
MTQSLSVDINNIIYDVKRITVDNWNVFYYQEFENILVDNQKINDDIWEKLDVYLKSNFNTNFRIQLSFRSVPFLVAFFFDQKEIRIATSKLSSELFVLQQPDILNSRLEKVANLRVHAEKISGISYKNFPTVIEVLTKTTDLPDFKLDEKFKNIDNLSQEITK